MYDVANRLGRYYYEKDDVVKAREYFVCAFNSVKDSRKKNYRHNAICYNLYLTYMNMMSSSDSLKYKEEFIKKRYQFYYNLSIHNQHTCRVLIFF